MRRRIIHFLSVLMLVLTMSQIASTVPALADCGDPGAQTGNDSLSFGAASPPHVADIRWDSNGHTGTLHLDVYTSNLGSGRSGDTWFDWSTGGGGHYDSRLMRDYQDNSFRGNGAWGTYVDSISGDNFYGMQKGAGCVWDHDTQSFVTCTQDPHRDSGCNVSTSTVNPLLPNYDTRAWIRWGDGSTAYQDGGDPQSGNS